MRTTEIISALFRVAQTIYPLQLLKAYFLATPQCSTPSVGYGYRSTFALRRISCGNLEVALLRMTTCAKSAEVLRQKPYLKLREKPFPMTRYETSSSTRFPRIPRLREVGCSPGCEKGIMPANNQDLPAYMGSCSVAIK